MFMYQVLRAIELRHSEFQLNHKHMLFGLYFYVGQYLILFFVLIDIIFLQTGVFDGEATRLYFFVLFPLIFLQTTIGSVLESIIRVEEKIFINKKA